jgi:glycosyltransferase involved in cell wall biosynthesis
MACGLPIICYDRGGQTDFLTSGETGFVVKLNDVIAFGQAVRAIHADIYLRRTLSQRNRQLVENYFIDSCAARYEKVFEAAIGRRLAAERGVAPTSH